MRYGTVDDFLLVAFKLKGQSIEPMWGFQLHAFVLQTKGNDVGQAVNALSDRTQALWAVVDGIERRHIGQQYLCGTDVRVGLLTTDVLFTGLHRHAQCQFTAAVFWDTDNTARQWTLVLVTGRKEGSVWTTVAHRYTEALRRTKYHVGTHFAWRLQHHQAHDVSSNRYDTFFRLYVGNQLLKVVQLTKAVWVLEQGSKYVVVGCFTGRSHNDFKAKHFSAGFYHVDGLWVDVVSDEISVRFALADALGHCHGFGSSSGFV